MALFLEDSDDDSIKTDTTAESSHSDDEGFNVEDILAEDVDDRGVKKYLVKWEGYALDRCTWETRDMFGSHVPLAIWTARKKAAARGGPPLFDVDVYNAAFEHALEEKEAKARRRRAKRKKRGEIVSRSQSPVKAAEGATEPAPPARRRASGTASTVERKVVAQKVATTKTPAETAIKTTRPVPVESAAKPTASAAMVSAETTVKPARPVPGGPTQRTAAKTAHSSDTASKPARKTAPSAPLIAPSVSVRKRKQNPRVSGDTPKDSTTAKFKNLATQNRFQKNGRNEPAPNINDLTFIDPMTGKPLPKTTETPVLEESVAPEGNTSTSKTPERRQSHLEIAERPMERATEQAPAAAKLPLEPLASRPTVPEVPLRNTLPPPPGPAAKPVLKPPATKVTIPAGARARPSELHGAYGRRSPTSAQRRQRSSSPPAQGPVAQSEVSVLSTLPPDPPKRSVCQYWREGNCRFTAATCRFAHSFTDKEDLKPLTCFFWRFGNLCKKPADQCSFAHWDTGNYAPPPPGHTPEAHKAMPAREPEHTAVDPTVKSVGLVNDPSTAAAGLRTYRTAGASPLIRVTGDDQSENGSHAKQNDITCYYWINGNRCKKPASECKFAHRDTGEYAAPPPSIFKRDRADVGPISRTAVSEFQTNYDRRPKMPVTPVPAAYHHIESALPPVQSNSGIIEDGTPMQSVATPNTFGGAEAVPDQPIEGLSASSRSVLDDLKLAKRSINHLDASELLSGNGKHVEHVYVLMLPDREGERKLLADFFRSCNCKVWHSSNKQHWKIFEKTHGNGLIVIHPSETFDGTIPGLATHMRKTSVWVFSVGVHEYYGGSELQRRVYEAKRLFPHGGMTFISDDVFTHYPEKATEIIQEFLARARVKPKGGELSKIGARPGIRDWLSRLAVQKMEEGGENYTDERYVKCWDAVCELCPLDDYDPWEMEAGRMITKNSALLWSVAEQDTPGFHGVWEADEARATDAMANFFAGTAVERMPEFRRYCFIYQRPDDRTSEGEDLPASQLAPEVLIDTVDPRGWMKRYNHIEVLTPEAWLEMIKRKP